MSDIFCISREQLRLLLSACGGHTVYAMASTSSISQQDAQLLTIKLLQLELIRYDASRGLLTIEPAFHSLLRKIVEAPHVLELLSASAPPMVAYPILDSAGAVLSIAEARSGGPIILRMASLGTFWQVIQSQLGGVSIAEELPGCPAPSQERTTVIQMHWKSQSGIQLADGELFLSGAHAYLRDPSGEITPFSESSFNSLLAFSPTGEGVLSDPLTHSIK